MKTKQLATLLVALVIALTICAYTPVPAPANPQSRRRPMAEVRRKAFIDPALLSGDPDQPRLAILMVRSDFDYSRLLPYTKIARGTPSIAGFKLIRVLIKPKDVHEIAELDGVIAIKADQKIPYEDPKRLIDPEVTKSKAEPTLWWAVDIIGASQVWIDYGYDGSGVRIAIIDTGVDFGHPDLAPAQARNATGYPLHFDADAAGLINTTHTYTDTDADDLLEPPDEGPEIVCVYDPSGDILHVNMTEFLNQLGATGISISEIVDNGYSSQSGDYHVGILLWDGSYYGYSTFGGQYIVVFVDNGTAGRYEAVFIDLNNDSKIEWGKEGPFDWGHNNAVAADFDEDGSLDISLGALGGTLRNNTIRLRRPWNPVRLRRRRKRNVHGPHRYCPRRRGNGHKSPLYRRYNRSRIVGRRL